MSHASRTTPISGVPIDLVGITLLGLWVLVSPLFSGFSGLLQVALGLLAVFFAPGYALVATLFPHEGRSGPYLERGWLGSAGSRNIENIDPTRLERFVLSVGLSVCLVPLLVLGLDFTAWELGRRSVLTALGGLTLVFAVVASVRRWQVPASNRFTVSLRLPRIDASDRGPDSSRSTVTPSLVLTALLVVAAAGVGFAAWHPTKGEAEQFTEFYLQTPDGSGELVAGGGSGDLSMAAGDQLYLGVTNREGEPVHYTVVSKVQRFSSDTERRTVVAERQFDRSSVTVDPGATEQFRYTVDGTAPGETNRLIYLLYVGEPPADPTAENAYRQVHVWVGDDSSA